MAIVNQIFIAAPFGGWWSGGRQSDLVGRVIYFDDDLLRLSLIHRSRRVVQRMQIEFLKPSNRPKWY